MYVEKPVKVTDGDTIDITNKGKFTTKSSNDKDDVEALPYRIVDYDEAELPHHLLSFPKYTPDWQLL